jgi:tetratricopeptide (TPR) repeat protein
MGKYRPEYFAARAALQAGLIYEKRGEKDKAIEAFKNCLSLNDHDFKDSLDQRAKSGIARCNGE